MGQKINPTAFRLAVTRSWLATSSAHTNFIFDLVHGTFLAFNIFTSFPVIKITPGSINIVVKVMGDSRSEKSGLGPTRTLLNYVAMLLRAIIQKKLNTRVQLTLIRTSTPDAKIWGDMMAQSIANKPLRLKGIVKTSLSAISRPT